MILIAMGANLPFRGSPPRRTLHAALLALNENGVTPIKVSSLHQTVAWPDPTDPPFLNAVAEVRTAHDPAALLSVLHKVEKAFGRSRERPNAPRTLDLDLIDYDGRIAEGPPVLPHPRLSGRGFVLAPLAEIAPDWRHPVCGLGVAELLAALESARDG